MIGGQTLGMVCQYLDDPTIRNASAFAVIDHSLQFLPKCPQARKPTLNLQELVTDDLIGGVA